MGYSVHCKKCGNYSVDVKTFEKMLPVSAKLKMHPDNSHDIVGATIELDECPRCSDKEATELKSRVTIFEASNVAGTSKS